jgi:hypothetical protein
MSAAPDGSGSLICVWEEPEQGAVSVVRFDAVAAPEELANAGAPVVDGEQRSFRLEMFLLPSAGRRVIYSHIGCLFIGVADGRIASRRFAERCKKARGTEPPSGLFVQGVASALMV